MNEFVRNSMRNCLLEGPVEIAETLIYKIKRGQAHGRLTKIRIWLFGIKSRETGNFVLYPLRFRTRDVILRIILRHVPHGGIVNNRMTPKTSHLTQLGYHHFFVEHQSFFVSPLSNNINTNTIVRMWRCFIKMFSPRFL